MAIGGAGGGVLINGAAEMLEFCGIIVSSPPFSSCNSRSNGSSVSAVELILYGIKLGLLVLVVGVFPLLAIGGARGGLPPGVSGALTPRLSGPATPLGVSGKEGGLSVSSGVYAPNPYVASGLARGAAIATAAAEGAYVVSASIVFSWPISVSGGETG